MHSCPHFFHLKTLQMQKIPVDLPEMPSPLKPYCGLTIHNIFVECCQPCLLSLAKPLPFQISTT